tara:strand:- start:1903 stop:2517 length:615 start_codon:yes stop_codon:yes gene_type:complete
MNLYSGEMDPDSHKVRIVLAEKAVAVEITNVDVNHPSEDLLHLNPYNTVPTLVDRELVLYEPQVIMEYLDERFPHPPLLSVYPVTRAKSRLMLHRIEQDWYSLMRTILYSDDDLKVDAARHELKEGLIVLEPVFLDKPYFLSEEFSLVDCSIAPLLWRLPLLGITLPPNAKGIQAYQERIFERESFQASLSESEREIRAFDDFE